MTRYSTVLRLVCLAVSLVGSASADPVADVSIEPVSQTVAAGDSLSLAVSISGVTDLFGYQFDVTFDPSKLAATSVVEGPFLSGGGTTFFVSGSIDNVNGSITGTADVLLGGISGVTGDGTLTDMQFEALSSGSTLISISNLQLVDSNLDPITATSSGASVTVTGVSSVPEPTVASLFVTGLFFILLLSKTCRPAPRVWSSARE